MAELFRPTTVFEGWLAAAHRERDALKATRDDLLAVCEAALSWAVGENSEGIPEECFSPLFAAYVAQLRSAIAKAKGESRE